MNRVKHPKRRQTVRRDSYNLYPQSLEVLVPLTELYKLFRSDRCEGQRIEGEQERASSQISQADHPTASRQLKVDCGCTGSKCHRDGTSDIAKS